MPISGLTAEEVEALNNLGGGWPASPLFGDLLATIIADANTGGITIYKPADEGRVSDTVLAADSVLVLNVTAGITYRFHGRVFFNATGTSGLKLALGGTCTFDSLKIKAYLWEDTTLRDARRLEDFIEETSHSGAGTGAHLVELDGSIEVATSGTLLVRWAQQNSRVEPLYVQRGSYLVGTRL